MIKEAVGQRLKGRPVVGGARGQYSHLYALNQVFTNRKSRDARYKVNQTEETYSEVVTGKGRLGSIADKPLQTPLCATYPLHLKFGSNCEFSRPRLADMMLDGSFCVCHLGL